MSLITKLETSIEDSTLLKLGEMKLHVRVPSGLTELQRTIKVRNNSDLYSLYTIGGRFADGSNRIPYNTNIGGATTFVLGEGEYDVVVENKYGLIDSVDGFAFDTALCSSLMDVSVVGGDIRYNAATRLRLTNLLSEDGEKLNVAAFADMAKLKELQIVGSESEKMKANTANLDVSAFNSDVEVIKLHNQSGVIGSLSALTSTEKLRVFELYNTAVEGEIKNLSKNVTLTNLNLAKTRGLTGSLNDLLDALYDGGKTTGTIVIYYGGNDVTFNGVTSALDVKITANFTSSGWTV